MKPKLRVDSGIRSTCSALALPLEFLISNIHDKLAGLHGLLESS
jgi:hypothetical protein